MKDSTRFSFWSYSKQEKELLQSELATLKTKIEPLKAWVIKTKQEHLDKGTDPLRDAQYVTHATRYVEMKTEYKHKQIALNRVTHVRMDQYQMWQAEKALQNQEAFADTGICTA